MKPFERIIEDIERGENIDLYVAVVAAIIVAILNFFGVTSQSLINSLSLALFALIASTILGNRHRLEDIRRMLEQSGKAKIVKDYPREQFDEDIANASEIWLFGVHLVGTLRHHRNTLEARLRKRKLVRVLVVDPNGAACAMAAARNPGKGSWLERERASIVTTLSELCELRKTSPGRLEIRIIDDPLMYGGCMLDPDSANGKIYIHRYSYQMGIRPKFIWDRNSEWFNFIKNELKSLWDRGRDYECDPPL